MNTDAQLYPNGPPENPRNVFGRAQIISEILEDLNQGVSVTVTGPRRIGLSSVLTTLSRHEWFCQNQVLTAYFNLENYYSQQDFLKAVADLMVASLESLGCSRISSGDRNAGEPLRIITDAVNAFRTAGKHRPVLFLDHFERQAGKLLDEATVRFFRGLLDASPRILSIVATSGGPVKLSDEFSYFRLTNKRLVRYLHESAVTAMLTLPLQQKALTPFNETEMVLIRDAGGYHPAFLAMACRTVLDFRGRQQVVDADAFEQEFLNRSMRQYRSYFEGLSESQRKELHAVAQGVPPKSLDHDVRSLCIKSNGDLQLFSHNFAEFILRQIGGVDGTPATSRELLFFSYSRKDRDLVLEDYKIVFEPYSNRTPVRRWIDVEQITHGEFETEIRQAMTRTKVAVLFVSPHYLASEFVNEVELPALVSDMKQGKAKLVWVALDHSGYELTDLKGIQCLNEPKKPMRSLPKPERARVWNEICKKILALMQ